MSTPEEIQRDIERTRGTLSADVDRLTEKVSPGRVVSRRVDRIKSGATTMKERVMGSMPDTGQLRDTTSSVGDAAGSAASKVGDAASSVGQAAASAPQAVRRQTQGNPLGAGLVAFGIGMVLSSLIPATRQEEQLAQQAEEQLRGPVQEAAKDIASELQESAKQSAEQVKDVATNAASETADQARSAAQDVKAPLQQ